MHWAGTSRAPKNRCLVSPATTSSSTRTRATGCLTSSSGLRGRSRRRRPWAWSRRRFLFLVTSMALETTNGVAFWLTYQELLLGEIKSIDEEVALVDGVTAADVRRVAQEVLGGPMQMAVIGPFTRDSAFRLAIGA